MTTKATAKLDLEGTPEGVAQRLREVADALHKPFPWAVLYAFLLGMTLIAAMDYGDVWLCLGSCPSQEAAR